MNIRMVSRVQHEPQHEWWHQDEFFVGENGIVPSGKLMALCQAGNQWISWRFSQPLLALQISPVFSWVFSVDPWKVHLADLALQLEGGRSGHRKGTVPSTRQPLAYLQHSVDHILLRKPKRSFAATKAISGKPSFQTVNVTFPPCFGFFGTSRFKGNTSWKPQHSCSG